MKLEITRRAYNVRTRRVEGWSAATPCGMYTAERLEWEDTPWELFRHAPGTDATPTSLGLHGSLRSVQRALDRIVAAQPQEPTEAPRS